MIFLDEIKNLKYKDIPCIRLADICLEFNSFSDEYRIFFDPSKVYSYFKYFNSLITLEEFYKIYSYVLETYFKQLEIEFDSVFLKTINKYIKILEKNKTRKYCYFNFIISLANNIKKSDKYYSVREKLITTLNIDLEAKYNIHSLVRLIEVLLMEIDGISQEEYKLMRLNCSKCLKVYIKHEVEEKNGV